MDIRNINPSVDSIYKNYLDKINYFIKRKEISITSLAKYLKVRKRDTVYDYLDGTHIIPADKFLMLIALMKQEGPSC